MLRTLLLAALAVTALQLPAFAQEAKPDAEAAEGSETQEVTVRSDDPFLQSLDALRKEAREKAKSPEAILPLSRAMSLKDHLSTLAPLEALYAEFAEKAGTPPEVKAIARYLLANVERARGRMPRVRENLQKLGFVNPWYVAGPFDNEGKHGADTAYAPEKGIDLAAKFPGKAREIGWRKLPDVSADGFIDLGSVLRPTNETLTYAFTVLDSAAEQRVVLHLGSSGAARVWVNGVKVFSEDAYHPPRLDQVAVAVNLRKGANHVLLKVAEDTGPYGFFFRVSAPNGDALANVTASAPDAVPAMAKGKAPQPEVQPTLVEYFRKRADAAKADARARADYAEVLHLRRTFDSKERLDAAEAARAARMAPADGDIQLLAARTEDDNQNERRRFLEAAVQANPDRAAAVLALADFHLGRGYPRRTLDLCEAALKKSPRYFPLKLELAKAYEELGMPVKAAKLIEELGAAMPDRYEVVRARAQQARREERMKDAVSLYRVALGVRFDDRDSRRALSGLLADLGDVDGALREQKELIALEPWDAFDWMRLGELAAANGKADDARKAFARAGEMLPEEADIHERTGRALARLGDKPGATASFERALALKPQNVPVKEALKAMRGEQKGFGEEFAKDASKLIAENKPVPGEDSVQLEDLNAVKVFPSGLASRFVQQVVRVQTPRGVESERAQWITYSPDRQELKILKARVIRPDGAVLETHNESERSLSDNESKLYYDARARIVSFPNLAPGDVVELSYRLEDTANDNLLSDYFGDLQSIQAGSPKANFDYILSAPKGRTIYSNTVPLPNLTKAEEPQPDGSTLYRWSAKNVAKITAEPAMPGYAEVAATLHVSTYKDWDAVGRYYWGLVRDQLVVSDEIRSAVKEISANVPPGDELAMVRAVYDFVVSRTRYVGLEFGIHGFKPYKVDKILSRRFGDCKDKASLMHAMLEVAGIDSRLVLLRMKRLGKIDTNPASLSAFNHAILYVPKFDMYLDGTAEFYGSRELPTEDHGALVLVVQPNGGTKIGVTPDAKPDDNVTRSEFTVALEASGKAAVSGKTNVTGLAAPDYRRAYSEPSTRKQIFEQAWARSFPGLSVKSLEVSDLKDIEKDVQLAFAMEMPRYAHKDDASLLFSPFGEGRSYLESWAPLSSRKQDLVVSYPWANEFKYRIAAPQGFAAAGLPSDVDVKSPFGAVSLKYRKDGEALVVEGKVMVGRSRIAAADYPAFRAFLAQIDQAMNRKVRLEKAVPAPKSAER